MIDHRRLQRALFRMQHDAGFAERLRSGDARAAASTGLGATELGWLRAADPAAVSADRGGKRAAQLLRNVTSELALSTRYGGRDGGLAAWAHAFPSSPQFHRAVTEDGSLPLAFVSFAEGHAARAGDPVLAGLVTLDAAMARARRIVREAPRPGPDEIVRSGAAHLVPVPAGLFAFASALRAALDRGDASLPKPPRGFARAGGRETLLVVAAEPEGAFRLRPVRVEPLVDLVAAFLEAAGTPLDAAARAAFAARHAVDPDELDSVVKEFVADGTLLRSPAAR